jgi:hypothetical protein
MKKIKAATILTFILITGCAEPLTDAQVKALIGRCEKTGKYLSDPTYPHIHISYNVQGCCLLA